MLGVEFCIYPLNRNPLVGAGVEYVWLDIPGVVLFRKPDIVKLSKVTLLLSTLEEAGVNCLIVDGEISNPPIEADLNKAKPSELIDDETSVPDRFEGVDILSAVILPWTVRVEPSNCKKLPPDLSPNNTLDAVILPSAFNLSESSDDLISLVLTVNPAIEADTNLAKPSDVIEAEAFVIVEGEPFINAGVCILSTLRFPLTTKFVPSYSTYWFEDLLPAKNSPEELNTNSLLDAFICSVLTSNPPIEADTNLANPWLSIEDDALVNVEGDPFITAGVLILSTLKSPLTTKLEPSYCTYCCRDLMILILNHYLN